MSTFLLPLSEFNRIHQVIHGTIKDEGNPGKACTLFGTPSVKAALPGADGFWR